MRLVLTALLLVSSFHLARAQEWERLTPPDLNAGVPVLDAKRGELHLLSLENGAQPGDEWILELARPDRWRRVSAGGAGPKFDDARGAFYDRASDRILVLARDPAIPSGPAPMAVWARSLAVHDVWRRLPVEGNAPIERWEYAFVIDRQRSDYVLFGGASQQFGLPEFNDVWRLRIEDERVAWTQVHTSGDSLSSRSGAGAIYDGRRDRMILFGGGVSLGSQAYQEASGDLVTIQFGVQADVTVRLAVPSEDGSHEVSHASCLYDSLGDRMVVTSYNSWAQPVRTLDLETLSDWTTAVPSTGSSNDLRVRWIALESSGRSGISLGGLPVASRVEFGPPYAFHPVGPGPDQVDPAFFTGTFPSFPDIRDGSTWVWGGFLTRDPGSANVLWRFAPEEFPHWFRHELSGDVPPAQRDPTAAYDARRDRWYLFAEGSAELWAFDVSTLRWSRIDDGTSGPAVRSGALLAYDGLRDRLILWGGKLRVGFAQDAWARNLGDPSGWTPIEVSARHPHDRAGAVGSYDAARDRLVVHGGSWQSSTGGIGGLGNLNDTWALSFGAAATWDSLTADPRELTAISFSLFDPARRAVDVLERRRTDFFSLVGGMVLKELDGDRWTDVVVGGLTGNYGVAFDPSRDRLLSFGGGHLGAAWKLDRQDPTALAFIDVRREGAPGGALTVVLHGGPWFNAADVDPATCTLAGASAARDSRSAKAYLRDVDSDGFVDRMIRFDARLLEGAAGFVEFTGRTRLGLGLVAYARLGGTIDRMPFTADGDPDSPTDSVRPLDFHATAFERGIGTLVLDLPRKSAVRVDVFGVNGRRIAGRDLGELEPGSYPIGGLGLETAQPGIYFARVTAGTERVVRRLLVLE
jgi:hypothetical protein